MSQDNSNSHITVIPLGGVEEIGINATVIGYKDQLILIDLGMGFPDADMYGVDYVVPNISYLEKNKHRLEAIFITHGHLDHIGALPYLLPKLDFPPIYATEFTLELIKHKLADFGLDKRVKFITIKPDTKLQSGDFKVEFFHVNHSIPQAVGIYISTPHGKIVHTGDFKFDNSPVNEPVTDYARLVEIGAQGIDLLLADSTNSLKRGHPLSESEVAKSLEAIIEQANGRVIIASFSGLVGRLYQLIQIADRMGKKVGIAGYGMQQSFQIAQQIGYIKPRTGVVVPLPRINKYDDKKVMILTTGAQGESNAALARMAAGTHPQIKLRKGDTVVLSAATIPGNNVAVQELLDAICQAGADVHFAEGMELFTSGHGYQEDQKVMLNLIKPKQFMPVHGYQYFLRAHGRTAQLVGMKESQVIIPRRGQIIAGSNKEGFQIVGTVPAEPQLVSGLGVGDVGTTVLSERHQLGNHGVVVVQLVLESAKKKVWELELSTKGFVYSKRNQELLDSLQKLAENVVAKQLKGPDIKTLEAKLETALNAEIVKLTGRSPMLIINVFDVTANQIKH